MPSDTEIANLAIRHLGTGKEISSLETGNSEEAGALRRYFDTARDQALAEFPWPFATKFFTLNLITADPTTEWGFSYGYPSDAERIIRICSGIRNDTHQSKVRYRIVYGASAREIYTDEENAVAEYIFRVTDTQRFPTGFVMALSFKLAFLAAPSLTAGDPFKLQERMDFYFQREISKARADAANEEVPDAAPASEFERVRE